MSFKACAYKGCENYELDGSRSGKFSFFLFPKDPQRRKEWMELGRVNENIPQTELCMCSEHFESKYISKNSRRLTLLGRARPMPYYDPHEGHIDWNGEQDDSKLYGIEIQAIQDGNSSNEEHDKNLSPSSDWRIATDEVENDEQNDMENKEIVEEHLYVSERSQIPQNTETHIQRKRKFENVLIGGLDEMKPSTVEREKNHLNCSTENLKNNDDICLIESSKVTVFIYKGEEYVQMPKSYYEDEKLRLLNKINTFKRALSHLKQSINSIDLDVEL